MMPDFDLRVCRGQGFRGQTGVKSKEGMGENRTIDKEKPPYLLEIRWFLLRRRDSNLRPPGYEGLSGVFGIPKPLEMW